MMRFAKALAINAAAPLLGIAAAIFAPSPPATLGEATVQAASWFGCAYESALFGFYDSCSYPSALGYIGLASIAVLALSLTILLTNRLFARIFGGNRAMLAMIFTPYAFLYLLGAGILGIAQMAILGALGWVAGTYWLDIDATWILILLGFVALALAGAFITQIGVFFTPARAHVAGRPVNLAEQPRLGQLIAEVAARTKGRVPDNVVLGLEPTFFATNAPVQTPYLDHPLKGETLHLSLPLMSLFTTSELKAVIGHELGHFSGQDTQYSRHFAPALASLNGAVEKVLEKDKPVSNFLMMPAREMLKDFVDVFGRVHGRLSRARETRADQLGASAASPEDICYSLVKASVGGTVWQTAMEALVERARKGRFTRNVVHTFTDRIRLDIDRTRLPPAITQALASHQQHPTDTHPTTGSRIIALGLDASVLLHETALLPRFFEAQTAVASLDNLIEIEEDLTKLYYHITAASWRSQTPEQKDNNELFLCLMADFLARMATIDGSLTDAEITGAEETAAKLFADFDRDGFRERCRHPEDIPDLDRMIGFANQLLTPTGADNLKAALRAVAEADGTVDQAEADMLDHIEAQLNPTS